jgi:hypothetical protein
MAKKKSYVAKELENAAKTYEERNAVYGDAYKRHGDILSAMFPEGITLTEPSDFTRFGLLSASVGKLNRYASQFDEGGHYDSAHDAAVYSTMLNEMDNEA